MYGHVMQQILLQGADWNKVQVKHLHLSHGYCSSFVTHLLKHTQQTHVLMPKRSALAFFLASMSEAEDAAGLELPVVAVGRPAR